LSDNRFANKAKKYAQQNVSAERGGALFRQDEEDFSFCLYQGSVEPPRPLNSALCRLKTNNGANKNAGYGTNTRNKNPV